MTIRVRLLLFTIILVVGALVASAVIGHRMGSISLDSYYIEQLNQARLNKTQALQTEFTNLSNSLLVAAELNRTSAALRELLRGEQQMYTWISAQNKEADWKAILERSYGTDPNPDMQRMIQHMHKLPLFLQSQFMQEAFDRQVTAKEIVGFKKFKNFTFMKQHELLHPFFWDYADRYQLADILLIDRDGTIVYTVQKNSDFGSNLTVGAFNNTRLAEVHRWSVTASPRMVKFFDFAPMSSFVQVPAAYLATPVFDKSEYLGTIVFQLPIEKIDNLLSDNHQWKKNGLKNTGEVVAVGADGLLRNNSRKYFENPNEFAKTYKASIGQDLTLQKIEQKKTAALTLGLPLDKVRHYLRSEESIASDKDYLGVDSIQSVGRVHLPGGVDWALIAKIDREETTAPLTRYLLILTIAFVVLLIGFIWASIVFTNRLIRPLRSLKAGLEKLNDHELKQRLTYTRKDEYAEIFEKYNLLAESLDETTARNETLIGVVHSLNELLFVVRMHHDPTDDKVKFYIKYANAAAGKAIGVPPKSLEGSELRMWIDADFEEIAPSAGEKRSTSQENNQVEGCLKKISGDKIPLSLSWSSLEGKNTEAPNLVIVATDIQWRKNSERELQLQENMFKESQAMSRTGSFRWEMDCGKMIWSDEMYRIFGLEQELTRPTFELFQALMHPDDVGLFDKVLKEAQKNLKPFAVDLRMRRSDNHDLIWIRAIGEFEYDNYGNAKVIWGINQNVTDLKRTELALIFEKDEALKSSQAKSEFLARMSHEIRTPMNAIMGMAELLNDTDLNGDQRYYVTIFRKAGEVLMALINDILDLSKIEAGEVSIENIPFDLRKMMTDVQEIMRPRALEKGVAYSFDIAKGVNPALMGDPTKLRQVLINLVSNSIKFTERGHIRVSVIKNPTKKDTLILSVSDSGLGIAADKQHLIFQKFSQTDSSITRRYGGTGLGLAISKSLVELMGGQIWFKSRENIGTTFFVTFPYREQVYNPSLQNSLLLKASALDFASGPCEKHLHDPHRKVRILLADDTEDNRILFTHYLKDGPYEIIEAENGLEAVDKIKSSEFDIVFMDVQMPEMDGYAATSCIRAWEGEKKKPHVPIIALTAHALSDDRQKSLKAGCDDHMTKPFKKNTLMNVIDRYSL